MTFKKYPKIYRLGHEDTDGILIGTCHVQEKIDGANTSIWLDKRGEITCGSRNRELSEGFNGFVEHVKNNENIKKLLEENPTYRLYGEYLVRHSISYNETAYKKFYLFDITEVLDGEESENFYTTDYVNTIAVQYNIPTPHYIGLFENPTLDTLKEYVGKSILCDQGEGIVIKNPDFINKWGQNTYAKIVTEKFKEDNAIIFGGNNKHSETYWEMYVVNKYMTLPRVQKVMNKLQPLIEKRLDMEHIPRVSSTAYHDMLTEEIWEIGKKVQTINFKSLNRLATRKAIQIYKDILNGDVSVADKINEE